jgi:hypothetical protein
VGGPFFGDGAQDGVPETGEDGDEGGERKDETGELRDRDGDGETEEGEWGLGGD